MPPGLDVLRVAPPAVRPLPMAGPTAALSVPAGVVYGIGRIDASAGYGAPTGPSPAPGPGVKGGPADPDRRAGRGDRPA